MIQLYFLFKTIIILLELSQKMINGIDITCIDSSHSIGNIISYHISIIFIIIII